MGCYPGGVLDQRGGGGTSIELRNSNKAVTYSGSPEEIESSCAALDAADDQTEGRKTAMVAVAALGGVVGFGGVMLDAWGVAVSALIVVVAALLYYGWINDDDIEDRKLRTARELLRTLRPELKPGRPAQLGIDFRLYDNSKTDGVWMTLATTLDDDTGLKLDISTHYKRKTRPKRKYTKIKDKLHERITLTFTPPKGRRFNPEPSQPIAPARISTLTLRTAKVSPRATVLTYASPQMLRVRGRGGWSNHGLMHLIDERDAVSAIIASYRALAESGITQAA